MKNSFVMYTDYQEQVKMLSNEQAGVLLNAILEYVSTGEVIQMDGMTSMAFSFIRNQIDRDAEKYEETCEKRREAGRLGGRPKANGFSEKAKKANGFSEKQTKANESKRKQTKAKKPDNEDDNDNDDEYEDVVDTVNENEDVKDNTPHNPPKGKTKAQDMIDAFKKFLPDYNFSPGLTSSIEDWCTYKIEKKQPYTETGVRKFLNEIDKQWKAHGESAVIDVIDQTMASGYQGITWDRISKVKPVESTASRVQQVRDW